MQREQGKQLVSMIDALVEENEESIRRCSLLESILVRSSIYFAAFTASEEIHYHNIPGADHLRSLADCEYILEAENLEKIRSLISLSENLGDDEVNITLKNTILEFTLFTLSEFPHLYFLQITLFNQPKTSRRTSDENELERTETKLEDMHNALRLLDEIRNIDSSIDSSEKKNQLKREIQEHYIEELKILRDTVNDPIVSLCLEIINNNLEEFVSPAGSLSRLYEVLTPSEIQVAEFIRMGKTSKDIADALDIAQKTVENHRSRVRDKLGLRNRGINLRSYLMQLEGRGSDFPGTVRVRRGKPPS